MPIGYELEGELLAPLLPGQPAVALRFSRNGVPALGLFTSTEVQQLLLVTKNSVYRVTAAPDGVKGSTLS